MKSPEQLLVSTSSPGVASRTHDKISVRHVASIAGGNKRLAALSWLVPLLVLVVWEVVARLGLVSAQILPAPSKIVQAAVRLTIHGSLIRDMGISILRATAGYLIGGGVGFFLGVVVGFSRIGEALIDRSVQMIRAIPFLAALPLVIVWFGVGEGAKIFLVSLGVSFPIYVNTVLGIRQIDPKLLELGRVQGLSN